MRGWRTERWSTPWTALRWAVPELAGWEGRAVYMDCPQIVLGDVAEIARVEMPPGAMVLVRTEGRAQGRATADVVCTGCIVFDCAEARRHLPPLDEMRADVGAHQAVGALLARRPRLAGDLPAGWGVRDAAYSADPSAATGSVHCDNLYMQPHAVLAAERLRREGRRHWFGGVRLPHFSPGLVGLFDAEYAAAIAAGYEVGQYVPSEPWGEYDIGGGK